MNTPGNIQCQPTPALYQAGTAPTPSAGFDFYAGPAFDLFAGPQLEFYS